LAGPDQVCDRTHVLRQATLEQVYAIRAQDEAGLVESVALATADSLFEARTIGEGPSVVAIAAMDREGLERALAVVKKSGFDSALDELRAKQGVFVRSSPPRTPDKIALLFSGQGAQYPGMMRRLSEEVPAALEVIERADRWLGARGLAPISPVLFSGEPIPNDVFGIQAAILCADLMCYAALSETLTEVGAAAEVVTGHSFGDYAALAAVEAWTIEDALFAAQIRSHAIEETSDNGGMLSVFAPLERIAPVLRELKHVGHVQAANINAPDQIVIAGTPKALRAARERFEAVGIEVVALEVPRAFHSSLMASARELLAEHLDELTIHSPKKPYLSSITRRFETDPEAIRRSLADQLTAPVNFVEQIDRLLKSGVNVFIECGPRGVLASLTRRIALNADVAIATTDDKDRPGCFALAKVKAMLEARRPVPLNGAISGTASAAGGAIGSNGALSLTLLEGDPARSLLAEQGFDEFWVRTRPTILSLIEGLWAAERKRPSNGPAAASPEEPDIPIEAPPLEVMIESEIAEEPEPEASFSIAGERQVIPSVPRIARSELESFLVEAFAKETGYPPNLIDVGADLEADLGIDTVKQAQVLGKVRDRFNLRTDEKLALRDFPTIDHIVRYVEKSLTDTASAPASANASEARSRVPIVDLTQQRSRPPKS
jgi:malonyl CoA-acyl carrier protein transacylase